ncbi:MAG: hypothetical protein ACYCUV_16310 [Phycisphaerae bacterium]|jgi:hypothetical protein
MDINYPVEIVIGLLVLLGLVFLAHHQAASDRPRVQQAVEHVVPMTLPAHK